MTARAGDALSHVYFSRPPSQFSKPIFEPVFKRRVRSESAATILPPAPAPERRVTPQRNGSARICMGAMSHPERTESGSPPFTCRNFVNTNEHLIHQ